MLKVHRKDYLMGRHLGFLMDWRTAIHWDFLKG
jgi:hypothetical protein